MNKRTKVIIALVVLIVLGFFGYRALTAQKAQPTYQTAVAEKGSLVTAVTASGSVSQGSSVNITTQVTGVVDQVFVKDGDSVTAGQNIASIIPDTASSQKQTAALASYMQANNNILTAKNTLNTLQSSLFAANQKFINDAVARGLTTDNPTYIQEDADWLAAENAYKNQQGVIAAASTAASGSWLSYVQLSSTVTAPMAGVISGLTVTPGSSVTSTSTSTSSTPATLGTVVLGEGTPKASVNLTEIDVVKVKPGQKVTMTLDALPDKTFTGVVSAVNTNGQVSSNVTTYPATITFDTAANSVYPNMGVAATIITDVKNNVILVPSAAVQTTGGQSIVRVMKNGQVSSVPVEVGGSNDTQTEIISGLSEGDTVVTGQTSMTGTGASGTSPFGNTRGGFGGGFGGGGNVRVIQGR